ncbi:MAG: glycoside hydrolase family 15 protein [Gammaproteobacteria bacterium]
MNPRYKHDKPGNIEDYALLGDMRSAALVDRQGSIDWLCVPRFDSPACFAALLGRAEHGHWLMRPAADIVSTSRRYRGDTLILESDLHVSGGAIRIIDFMATGTPGLQVVRIVEGLDGEVPLWMQLVVRFDYGSIIPWARRDGNDLYFIAGPDSLLLRTPVEVSGEGYTSVAEFSVKKGERIPFVLSYYASHETAGPPLNAELLLEETEKGWLEWSAKCTYKGASRDIVQRSLITLKALTYAPTGGIVAAPTTSLPEAIGGIRNWDYRYCWLRDASFTLYALLMTGYQQEAIAWREWLLRAIAGRPQDLQILYGLRGERRLDERELDWLPGYHGSKPVRIGNGAARQFQLDVYGEVVDMLALGREVGLEQTDAAIGLKKEIMEFLESGWSRSDSGIWEVRGPQRHFTHSKNHGMASLRSRPATRFRCGQDRCANRSLAPNA